MSDGPQETLKLDLDSKDFQDKIMGALDSVKKLGESKNIDGLVNSIAEIAPMLGIIGVAAFGLKEAFDAVFDAEKIERVRAQFDMFAKSAGIAADELKEGLVAASKGLAGETEILEAANKALSTMGDSTFDLTRNMDLATKVTQVFGGTVIDSFNTLNKAVETGNVRMLRQYGVIVDTDKVLRTYAASIGKYKDDLTELEKKHAVGNAALEKLGGNLKDVQVKTDTLTVSTAKLNTEWTELKDGFVLLVEKVFKPVFLPVVNAVTDAVHGLGVALKQTFGDAAQKNAAGIEILKDKLKDVNEEINAVHNKEGFWNKFLSDEQLAKKISSLEAFKKQYEDKISELQKNAPEAKEAPGKSDGGGDIETAANDERIKTRTKFEGDMLKLREARLNDEMAIESNYDALESERAEQLINMAMNRDQKIREIDQRFLEQGQLNSQDNIDARIELEKKYELEVKKIRQDMLDDDLRANEQQQKQNRGTTAGFEAGWKGAALTAKKTLGDTASMGKMANEGLTKTFVAGFKAIGSGSEDAADAMKKAFFGYLSEKAMWAGEVMIAESIWPPNPLGLAGGAALVALGAALGSMSGGGSSTSSPSSSSSSASSTTSDTTSNLMTAPTPDLQAPLPQRNVTIAVAGNYFETEQTKRTLMEMIRSETDATSFTYTQINQGVGS